MRISQIFNLNVTQVQLDFVDVDIDMDNQLYIDPYLISIRNDPWSVEVDRTIKNFFSKISSYVRNKEYQKAIDLFRFMSEPKETCLGVSKTSSKNGRGVGEENATAIINEIIRSRAIEEGIVNNIEDIIIFVDDVDKDKLSDMTTNIIRKHLIDYTKTQCKMWGIPLTQLETLPYWNPLIEDWDNSIEEVLVYNNRVLLLVPKSIVSYISEYNAQKYGWHFVITHERDILLARRSSLVKFKRYKNGKEKYYLPKKDVDKYINQRIHDGEFENKKDFLRQYTKENPALFDRFRESRKNVVRSLSNEEFTDFSGETSLENIVDALIISLENIPIGSEHATEYHQFIKSILEILFYPNLSNPTMEEKIHQGRKRVDILMTNIASSGFFHRLHDVHKIPCGYVFIECKNYSKDVSNPEIDQLSGRFAFNKGKFGILMCRTIDNKELLYQRCSDTYRDDRGLIIPLDDGDIKNMLNSFKSDSDNIESILEKIKRRIIISG